MNIVFAGFRHSHIFSLYDNAMKYAHVSGCFEEGEIIAFVRDELKKLGLFLKNRKTAVISHTKRQTVTGIVVNEKINLTKEYKKKIVDYSFRIKPDDGHWYVGGSTRMKLYFEDEAVRMDVTRKAQIIGYARMMRRTIRRDGLNRPDGQELIALCKKRLEELLPRVDQLYY